MQFYSFKDANSLNSDLAGQIKNILCEAIALRNHAYLVVSGGRSPLALFKLLAQTDLPWEQVTITLADERCVSLEDNDRNERLVRDVLLQHQAKLAKFISLYDEKTEIKKSMHTVELSINALPRFDVVILGMGEDGHTASLFPCSAELNSGLDDKATSILLVQPQTAPYQRVTLSKTRLLKSNFIFLPLLGSKKREVFEKAVILNNPQTMPISAFLNHANVHVRVMYAPQ